AGLLATGCGGSGGAADTPTTSPPPATAAGPAAPGPARYVFPVRGCEVGYGRVHHDYPATDVFAPVGCAFVAPTDGVVDEVVPTDRWDPATDRGADRGGRAVSVVGDDGVRYYGSHLRDVAAGLRPGERVAAGALLWPRRHLGERGDHTKLRAFRPVLADPSRRLVGPAGRPAPLALPGRLARGEAAVAGPGGARGAGPGRRRRPGVPGGMLTDHGARKRCPARSPRVASAHSRCDRPRAEQR
ncbi:MAG TPA: hypothetical protein VKP11_10000, partial [Frankiaceae bacterium]|nr:hypothetical protein [Frankiaceae bacterium]